MSNPAGQTWVGESFNAVGGCTNYCQTFTVGATNCTLQTINVYAAGGTGTGAGTNLMLRLFDLGSQSAPNPSSYAPGSDLFNSGSGLAINYTPQTTGVLQFDFTGADQVALQAGHMYAFELDGVVNSSPVLWLRTTNDTYAGGAAYRNRSWINGNSAREFALAVYGAPITTNPPVSGSCTVNWNDVRQRIDGFGGGVVFLVPGSLDPVTDANMDTLFGTNANQLALTLLRVRIDPTTNWSVALSDARKAVARGAGVLATPWTPPASMKNNNALTNGSLLPSQYANYAKYLKTFADYMASNGAPLRAISVQNEPDWPTTYESCVWSAAQFLSFFRTNAAAIDGTPVMMPESLRYNFSYSDPALDDPMAMANVDLIGGHLYGVTEIQDYPKAHEKGKPTWMTEFLLNDQTIESALATAGQIHDCLTAGNMSAYIWWKCLGDANGLVNASGVIQKRGFVMAQFSRFVRPSHHRIGMTYDGYAAMSAYKDAAGSAFAIVAINTNASTPVNQTFVLTNFTAALLTPWATSTSQSLVQDSALAVSNATFTYTLPPQSIVTFVGNVTSNSAPTLASVAGQTVNAGVTVVVTNSAADFDVPVQTLTFALLEAPTNGSLAIVTATNAIFTWRPHISQADSTNTIRVKVTDSGIPNLSATNAFVIKVNPVSQPTLTSISREGRPVSLTGTGSIGPDYTLLTSTNLVNWQPLFMTNPTLMPVTFKDTNQGDALRFYRLQLGP